VIGITPQLTSVQFNNIDTNNTWTIRPVGSRGIEIDEWLRANTNEKLVPYTYAILDNENDFLLHQAKHVVLTDPWQGLTIRNAHKIISILDSTL